MAPTTFIIPAAGPASHQTQGDLSSKTYKQAATVDCDSTSLKHVCVMCPAQGSDMKYCARCRIARYCSAECQKADWSHHKHICKHHANITPDKRPSPSHFNGILFPMAGEKPEPIWVQYDAGYGTVTVDHPDFNTFDGFLAILFWKTARPNGHVVLLSVNQRIAAAQGPKALNKSQTALGPGLVRPWFGPVVQVTLVTAKACSGDDKKGKEKEKGEEREKEKTGIFNTATETTSSDYTDGKATDNQKGPKKLENIPNRLTDVSPRDYRQAIDYFQHDPSNTGIVNPSRSNHDLVRALLISNLDDALNKAVGLDSQVLYTHTTAEHPQHRTLPLALPMLLGLSWYVRDGNALSRSVDNRVWKVTQEPCCIPRYLTLVSELAPFDESPEQQPTMRTRPLTFGGSVVLLHVTGVLIKEQQVIILSAYLDECVETGTTPTRAGFETFWAVRVRSLTDQGFEMAGVPSPYKLEDTAGDNVLDPAVEEVRGMLVGKKDVWTNFVRSMAPEEGAAASATTPSSCANTLPGSKCDEETEKKVDDWLEGHPGGIWRTVARSLERERHREALDSGSDTDDDAQFVDLWCSVAKVMEAANTDDKRLLWACWEKAQG